MKLINGSSMLKHSINPNRFHPFVLWGYIAHGLESNSPKALASLNEGLDLTTCYKQE